MNENMISFVKELRTTKVPQGRGMMRRDGCMCVAGLASDFYRRQTGIGRWRVPEDPFGSEREFVVGDGQYAYGAPPEVRAWLGCVDDQPLDAEVNAWVEGQPSLMHLNDSRCASFPEIADFIEAHDRVSMGWTEREGLRG